MNKVLRLKLFYKKIEYTATAAHQTHTHTHTHSCTHSQQTPSRPKVERKPKHRDRRNNMAERNKKKILLLNFLKILSLSYFFFPSFGCLFSADALAWYTVAWACVFEAPKKKIHSLKLEFLAVVGATTRWWYRRIALCQEYVISRLSTLQIWNSFVSTRRTSFLSFLFFRPSMNCSPWYFH